MFDLFEKLINEHGSATILKEQVALAKAEYAALQRKCGDLEAENKALKAQLSEVAKQAGEAQRVAGKQVFCKACGSPDIARTGARPDPIFDALGVDQILFRCRSCGAESAFTDA